MGSGRVLEGSNSVTNSLGFRSSWVVEGLGMHTFWVGFDLEGREKDSFMASNRKSAENQKKAYAGSQRKAEGTMGLGQN